MNFFNILKKYRLHIYFFILFFITAALYAQCIKYDYVGFDDMIFFAENSESISDFKDFARIFKTPVFNLGGFDYYRPVLMCSFLVDNLIIGNTSASHHVFNILFHLISVFLLFILFEKLKFDKTFSFLFVFIFAIHPAFAHAVAWIPGRNDSLLAIFVISAFIFLIDYCNEGRRRNLFAVIVLYFFALLTKETALAALIVFPVFTALFFTNISKKLAVLFLSMVSVSLLYVLIRNAVLPADFNLPSAFGNLFGEAKTISNYIEYLIMPSHIYLCPDKIPITFITAIACAIGSAPALASALFNTGNKKNVFFGFFWFIVFLLPTFMIKNEYLPHRTYLASVGLIIAYIEFFTAVSKKINKKYLVAFLVSFAVIFLFASLHQIPKFKNREIFLANAIDESPDSSMLRLKTAEYYAGLGMFGKAKLELEKVNPAKRTRLEYLEILGWVYAAEKNYLQACGIYERIIEINPNREPSLNNLAEIYNQLGQYDKAIALYGKLIDLRPEKTKYKLWRQEIENKKAG